MTRPRMLRDQNNQPIQDYFGVRQCFSKTIGVTASPVAIAFHPGDNTGYADLDEDGLNLLMEPNQIYELSVSKNIAGAPTSPSQINIYIGKNNAAYLVNPFFFTVFRQTVFFRIKLHSNQDSIKIERIGTNVEDVVVGIRKLS